MSYIGKLQKYKSDYFRLIEMKTYPAAAQIAYDNVSKNEEETKPKKPVVRGIHENKLPESLSRTRALVFEIMMCNEFEYFVTLTLNSDHDRNSVDVFRKTFVVWLKNYNKKYGLSIKYIIIPESHKDGENFHAHGAIMGLPLEHLTPFGLTDKLPQKMLKQLSMGHKLYNWPAYSSKFGYVSLSPIRDQAATAKYISKYITKNVGQTPIEINKRMFYASHGLNKSQILHQGEVKRDFTPDFENEYIKVKVYTNAEDALKLFEDDPTKEVAYDDTPMEWDAKALKRFDDMQSGRG